MTYYSYQNTLSMSSDVSQKTSGQLPQCLFHTVKISKWYSTCFFQVAWLNNHADLFRENLDARIR